MGTDSVSQVDISARGASPPDAVAPGGEAGEAVGAVTACPGPGHGLPAAVRAAPLQGDARGLLDPADAARDPADMRPRGVGQPPRRRAAGVAAARAAGARRSRPGV